MVLLRIFVQARIFEITVDFGDPSSCRDVRDILAEQSFSPLEFYRRFSEPDSLFEQPHAQQAAYTRLAHGGTLQGQPDAIRSETPRASTPYQQWSTHHR